jgi:hypothetical protein
MDTPQSSAAVKNAKRGRGSMDGAKVPDFLVKMFSLKQRNSFRAPMGPSLRELLGFTPLRRCRGVRAVRFIGGL